MPLKEKDFIEIEFVGKIKDTGEVFDSNIKKELEKLNSKNEPKPYILSLGQEMFLKGIDDFLIGKSEEPGEYEIELSPEKAFGQRNPELVKMVPKQVFLQQKLNPYPGVIFNFDGKIGKVLTVSGGRIRVDFNNPLAGKNLIYTLKILRKIDNVNEKIKSLMEFFFRKEFKFELRANKLIIFLKNEEKQFKQFFERFGEKFKEILGLELEVINEIEPEKESLSKEN